MGVREGRVGKRRRSLRNKERVFLGMSVIGYVKLYMPSSLAEFATA